MHMPLRRAALRGVIALLLVGLTSGAFAMFKFVMFSAMRGIVTQGGKPVEGATVAREYHWAWADKTGKDQTRTNAQGEFSLPELTDTSLSAKLLPHEPMVKQTVVIQHNGKTYQAWFHLRHDYEANTELGKPISVVCDLDKEPARHGDYFGICEVR